MQLFHNSFLLIPLDLAFLAKVKYRRKYLDRIYTSEPTPCGQSLSVKNIAQTENLWPTFILSRNLDDSEALQIRALFHFVNRSY